MRKTRRELKVSRFALVVESAAPAPEAAWVDRTECADDGGFEDAKRVPSLSSRLPALPAASSWVGSFVQCEGDELSRCSHYKVTGCSKVANCHKCAEKYCEIIAQRSVNIVLNW